MMRLYGTFPDAKVDRRLSASPESDVVAKVIMGVWAALAGVGVFFGWHGIVGGRVVMFSILGLGVVALVCAVVRARVAGPARRKVAVSEMRAHPASRTAVALPLLGDGLEEFLGKDAAGSFARCADRRLAWHERVDEDGRVWRAFVMWYRIEGDGRGYFAYETSKDRFSHVPDSLEVEVTYALGEDGSVVFVAYDSDDEVPTGRMPLEAAFLCGDGSPLTSR